MSTEDISSVALTLQQRKHPYAHCESCPMNGARFKPVQSFGPVEVGDVDVVVVGEAPGVEEIIAKKPFSGSSGQLMRGVLKQSGIDPNRAFYTNAVLCRPPDNKLEPYKDAVKHCAPRLERELQLVGNNDTPVLAVGKYAATAVAHAIQGVRAPRSITITRDRGQWLKRSDVGTVQKNALLTVHPAYVLRAPQVMPDFQADVALLTTPAPDHPLQKAPRWLAPKNMDDLVALLATVDDNAWVAFDVETTNLIWYRRPSKPDERLLMIGLAWSVSDGLIIDEDFIFENNVAIQSTLNEFFKRVRLTAHNGKFDCLWLHRYGFTEARVDFDTMLAHWVIRETPPHGLKDIAAHKYHVIDYERELVLKYFPTAKKEDRNYGLVPKAQLAQYLAWDLAITYQLRLDFEHDIREAGLFEWPFAGVLNPASDAFVKVEQAGIKVDVPHMQGVKHILERDAQAALLALRDMTGRPQFNPRSYKQVGAVLFDDLGFKPAESKHFTHRSTSAAALTQIGPDLLNHPFTKALFLHRRISKLLSSYVLPILDLVDWNGYVHASYRLLGTETGRLSASDPPIQTLPRAARDKYGPMIRAAFVAEDGWKLVIADYSQAEMRVWAHFCQDPFLLDVYRAGRDLHTEGAIKLFGNGYTKEQRTWVKNFNFAYIYGGNEYSFAGQYNLPIEQARAFVQEYERMMPVARKWRDKVFHDAMKRGYVETPFGRRRRFPLVTKETENEIMKAAWNMPIQSTASDLTLLALIQLVNEGYNVVLNVHDSIGVHCPASMADHVAERMQEVMVSIGELWIQSVPWVVDVDIQDRWAARTDDMIDDVIVDLEALEASEDLIEVEMHHA